MLALQDINAAEAKKKTSSFSHRYGAFEGVVEDAVPSACRLSSMALNKTVRTACERLLERHEDEVVTLYYEAGEAMRRGEDERDMGEALCGSGDARRVRGRRGGVESAAAGIVGDGGVESEESGFSSG